MGRTGVCARGDHIQDAAGEQAALGRILHDGQLAIGLQRAPLGMRFGELHLLRDALPVAQGRGFPLAQAAGEIVVERQNPASAGERRIGQRLQIALARDHGVGGRQVAQPDGIVPPGAHRADESGVGIDPRRAGGSGFGGAVFQHLHAGPYALVSADDGIGASQIYVAARGELDDYGFGIGQHILDASGGAFGEIALEHDALVIGADGVARTIGGIAARHNHRQHDDATLTRSGGESGIDRFQQQAIDGGSGDQIKTFGVGPVPAGRHPIGGRNRTEQRRSHCKRPQHPHPFNLPDLPGPIYIARIAVHNNAKPPIWIRETPAPSTVQFSSAAVAGKLSSATAASDARVFRSPR